MTLVWFVELAPLATGSTIDHAVATTLGFQSQVGLTSRDLVRQGLANKQIARRLGISERTVKAHLTSAFAAIGVTDLLLWREGSHKPNPNGPDREGPMVPARKVLLVASATSGLQALDPFTGRLIWKNKVPEGGR